MYEDLDKAISAMQGAVDETETIVKYTEMLKVLNTPDEIAEMKEIISDELNHIVRFINMYVNLTGIEIAED